MSASLLFALRDAGEGVLVFPGEGVSAFLAAAGRYLLCAAGFFVFFCLFTLVSQALFGKKKQ